MKTLKELIVDQKCRKGEAFAKTLPMAMCLSALRAVGAEVTP